MSSFIAVEANLVGALAGNVTRRTTLVTRFDLPIVVEAQLVLAKPKVAGRAPVKQATPEVAQAITSIRISLEPTARVDFTIWPEAVLNCGIRKFIGCIVHSEVDQRLGILWMGGIKSALNQRRVLEEVGGLLSIAEGDYELACGLVLEETHGVGSDSNLPETVEELLRGGLLRCPEVGRTKPIWGDI